MDIKSGKANLFKQAQDAVSSETKLTVDDKATAAPAPIVSVIAEKKAPVRSSASAKTESQLSASATQIQLSNQLGQKSNADSAQKKLTNNPLLKDETAKRGGQVRDNGAVDYHFFDHGRKAKTPRTPSPDPKFDLTNQGNWKNYKPTFTPAWNRLNHQHNIPKTLSTGNADDKVDIQMGKDGRVHVNVNDKEAWSGTPEEFKYLTIDTGGGNDIVTNSVDGADIQTGKGIDRVINKASHTTISTGDNEDYVMSEGNDNTIKTENGEGHIWSTGDGNHLYGGSDPEANDYIESKGSNNVIDGGFGNDTIQATGNNNWIQGNEGTDEINITGHYNTAAGGEQRDIFNVTGNHNTIRGDDGNDEINVTGDYNPISGGADDDHINVQGSHNPIDAGTGEDRVATIGSDNVTSGLDSLTEKLLSTSSTEPKPSLSDVIKKF